MNKHFIRILLLLGYCTPFAFLAVNGDASSGSMLFYGIMIAGFSLLCFGSMKTNMVGTLYAGNILSLIASLWAGRLSGLEPMGHYFKPFTSYSLMIVISVIAVIVQTVCVLTHQRRKK